MAKKKKKMTPAQAAAARRDDAKPKRKPLPASVKDDGPRDRTTKMAIMVTIAFIAVFIALSVFSAFSGIQGK